MGEVYEIFGGKKLTPKEIEDLEAKKTNVEPLKSSEFSSDGTVIGSGELAQKRFASLDKSLKEVTEKSEK